MRRTENWIHAFSKVNNEKLQPDLESGLPIIFSDSLTTVHVFAFLCDAHTFIFINIHKNVLNNFESEFEDDYS